MSIRAAAVAERLEVHREINVLMLRRFHSLTDLDLH